MRIHIIYQNFLNKNGKGMSIGGIQTYLLNLSRLFQEIGQEVFIYQRSDVEFVHIYEGIKVYGFVLKKKRSNFYKELYTRARSNMKQEDFLIFGDDSFIVNHDIKNSIAIQHGIFWDKPYRLNCSRLVFALDYIVQSYSSWKIVNRIKQVKQVVCVDYNFINWYRALVAHPRVGINIIPNFSRIPEREILKPEGIHIIFARRFFDYRGTRIFASAICKVLDLYPDIKVTLAGEGPDENYLKKKLGKYSQVSITRYDSSESLEMHNDKHIAVVPTLGSEGTSLSLLEAMASKCAVICTNVGGMTNIVIDRYNGLMINPGEQELYDALIELIQDMNLRNRLSSNAYNTVINGFSYNLWADRWKNILKMSECE